jgi:hypothetical protein
MGTEVSVLLFLKPSDEMEIEGGKATPKMLREKARELKERLERAADIFEKLEADGWELSEAYGSVYSLDFYKDVSEEEAKRELEKIGVAPEEVSIRELEEEEEEAEE